MCLGAIRTGCQTYLSLSTDVDGCLSAPCHRNAFCLHTVTVGYECLCNETGFTGDGASACDGEWNTIILLMHAGLGSYVAMCKTMLTFDAHNYNYVKRIPKVI